MSEHIMIASSNMVPELKKLWHSVFGDTNQYIDFYYEHGFKAENTLVYKRNEIVCGMLTMLPAVIIKEGIETRANYIYAVATHKDYRRQGIAGKLLNKAKEISIHSGMEGTFLVPATKELFSFYKKYGYHTAIYRRLITFPVEQEAVTKEIKQEFLCAADYEQYRGNAFRKEAFISWDTEALAYMLDEYRLCGGTAVKVSTSMESGAVLYHIENEILVIRESTLSETGTRVFVNNLLQSNVFNKACYFCPKSWSNSGQIIPFGMTDFCSKYTQYYFNLALD